MRTHKAGSIDEQRVLQYSNMYIFFYPVFFCCFFSPQRREEEAGSVVGVKRLFLSGQRLELIIFF